ncbi:MAG: SGNH/GDSL hydrolase family protein [Planctomycetota bacterium]
MNKRAAFLLGLVVASGLGLAAQAQETQETRETAMQSTTAGGATGWDHDPAVPEELRVRRGLGRVLAKLEASAAGRREAPVRVGYLGGSITRAEDGWRSGSFAWLQQRFPGASLEMIDAAVSGTGADFAACRLDRDLLRFEPDLVFVEYRVNLGGGKEARAIEGVVRQIREHNPSTDVVFVYTVGKWMLDDLRAGRQFWFGQTMERTANHYGIPSIDLGVEVVRRLGADVLTFQADGPEPGRLWFSKDGVHPSRDGHALYTEVIGRSLDVAFSGSADSAAHRLPAPLEADHLGSATLMPIAETKRSAGWEVVDGDRDAVYTADPRRTRAMLNGAVRTHRVGETVTVEWEGTAIALSFIVQGEGTALTFRINGGEPITATFDQPSKKNLFASFHYLPEQPQGHHTATIEVTALPAGGWV